MRCFQSQRTVRPSSEVLSKLAFNVLLPSYLMTRVAATLNSTPLTLSLARGTTRGARQLDSPPGGPHTWRAPRA